METPKVSTGQVSSYLQSKKGSSEDISFVPSQDTTPRLTSEFNGRPTVERSMDVEAGPNQDGRGNDKVAESGEMLEFNPGWKFYCLFAVLSACALVAALDANIVSVALPYIAHDLNGTAIETFWLGTSFLLTSCVLLPTLFSVSEAFGRKPVMIVIMVFFSVGTIVAAVAKNMTVLLLGRSIQGVGGGGILGLCNVIVTDVVPLRERGKWFGFLSATWAVASVSGPIIGGTLAEKVTWRWIFWIILPFCGICLVGLPIFLTLEKRPGSLLSKLKQIDWVGAILLTASITSFLMPISWGGVMFPWASYQTLLPLFLGFFGIIGFLFYEHKVATNPIVRSRVFIPRTAAVNYIGTTVHGIILWCMLYYLPLYYEAVKGYSATLTGVAIFPETFTVAPVVILVGILVSVTGRYRWALWAGWAITTLGFGIICLLDVKTTVVQFVFLNLVPGIGTGMLFSSTEYAIQAAVAESDSGMAMTMFSFVRTLGQTIGVAIGGVIFQSRLRIELEGYEVFAGKAEGLAKDASALVRIIRGMPSDSLERAMIIQAYASSLKIVWAVMAGLAGMAGLLSLLTEEISLDRALDTEQGFVGETKDRQSHENSEISGDQGVLETEKQQ